MSLALTSIFSIIQVTMSSDSTQQCFTISKLVANDGSAYDEFGNSVAISNNIAIVGNYEDGWYSRSAYVFQRGDRSSVRRLKCN